MQDMTPMTALVPERKRSEDELLLDLFAEVAMRAWLSARPKAPLTHRVLEALCKEVQHALAHTEAVLCTLVDTYDDANIVQVYPSRAHLLKCHNALWRRIVAHEASTRVSKMKPDGYVFQTKKLPAATFMRAKHGVLYTAMRTAAKSAE